MHSSAANLSTVTQNRATTTTSTSNNVLPTRVNASATTSRLNAPSMHLYRRADRRIRSTGQSSASRSVRLSMVNQTASYRPPSKASMMLCTVAMLNSPGHVRRSTATGYRAGRQSSCNPLLELLEL